MTKSPCPWNRLPAFRVERVQDHIDLSQQPANTVSDLGEMATEVKGAFGPEKVADTSAANFNIYLLDIACGFSHVDMVIILWIRDSSEDLGG